MYTADTYIYYLLQVRRVLTGSKNLPKRLQVFWPKTIWSTDVRPTQCLTKPFGYRRQTYFYTVSMKCLSDKFFSTKRCENSLKSSRKITSLNLGKLKLSKGVEPTRERQLTIDHKYRTRSKIFDGDNHRFDIPRKSFTQNF